MEGVVNDKYKLVRYYADGEDWWELYDRRIDSLEVDNLMQKNNSKLYDSLKKDLDHLKRNVVR